MTILFHSRNNEVGRFQWKGHRKSKGSFQYYERFRECKGADPTHEFVSTEILEVEAKVMINLLWLPVFFRESSKEDPGTNACMWSRNHSTFPTGDNWTEGEF